MKSKYIWVEKISDYARIHKLVTCLQWYCVECSIFLCCFHLWRLFNRLIGLTYCRYINYSILILYWKVKLKQLKLVCLLIKTRRYSITIETKMRICHRRSARILWIAYKIFHNATATILITSYRNETYKPEMYILKT